MIDQPHDPMTPHVPATHDERLWTPWRMRYVGGNAAEDDCIFCNRLRGNDDAHSLVLWRGDVSYVIMNLYPYNTGHVMLVPNEHADSPETADPAALAEMAALLPGLLRALRRVLGCHGFNVGLNVGAVAGAGIAAHLHQHVVPRWTGDANFMPILASTMVLPEVIPVTYAKLRAELEREFGGARALDVVILDRGAGRVAVDGTGRLPAIAADEGQPLWRTAASLANASGDVEILGWAGPRRAGDGRGALALRIDGDAPTGTTWRSAAECDLEPVARALELAGATA